MKNLTESIEKLGLQVNEAKTYNADGRQVVVVACKELYNLIEEGLYAKYGEGAVNDAYTDLCNGNFAEPLMCEKKKSKFELYKTVFINNILTVNF